MKIAAPSRFLSVKRVRNFLRLATNISYNPEFIDIPAVRSPFLSKKYWAVSVAIRDFNKYFSGKISEKKIPKMKKHEHFEFWLSKGAYFTIFVVVPALVLGWLPALIGYTIACAVCGLVLSIVFQLAHVVEDAGFPMPDEDTHKLTRTGMFTSFRPLLTLLLKVKLFPGSWED